MASRCLTPDEVQDGVSDVGHAEYVVAMAIVSESTVLVLAAPLYTLLLFDLTLAPIRVRQK